MMLYDMTLVQNGFGGQRSGNTDGDGKLALRLCGVINGHGQ